MQKPSQIRETARTSAELTVDEALVAAAESVGRGGSSLAAGGVLDAVAEA